MKHPHGGISHVLDLRFQRSGGHPEKWEEKDKQEGNTRDEEEASPKEPPGPPRPQRFAPRKTLYHVALRARIRRRVTPTTTAKRPTARHDVDDVDYLEEVNDAKDQDDDERRAEHWKDKMPKSLPRRSAIQQRRFERLGGESSEPREAHESDERNPLPAVYGHEGGEDGVRVREPRHAGDPHRGEDVSDNPDPRVEHHDPHEGHGNRCRDHREQQ